MKSILVATDLSARSMRAVERAYVLAAETGARLMVLSVVDDALPPVLAQGLAAEIRAMLTGQCSLLTRSTGCAHAIEVTIGDPTAEIVEGAARHGAELIVLGLHRYRRWADELLETTMERVARKSLLPVLAVHNASDLPYRNVLCAVDYSVASAQAALTARQIAPEAAFTLFHAYHAPGMGHGETAEGTGPFAHLARGEARAWAGRHPELEQLGEPRIVEGPVRQVFDRLRQELSPDLVAVGAHARPAVTRMMLGSFTRSLLRHPPVDVLVSHG